MLRRCLWRCLHRAASPLRTCAADARHQRVPTGSTRLCATPSQRSLARRPKPSFILRATPERRASRARAARGPHRPSNLDSTCGSATCSRSLGICLLLLLHSRSEIEFGHNNTLAHTHTHTVSTLASDAVRSASSPEIVDTRYNSLALQPN